MILTQCAVCATELGLSLGKKCGRCSTRYCGPECQKQHWEGGGHDKLCKKIKKAGGAEQYNANEKYTEAVFHAAAACAEDTKVAERDACQRDCDALKLRIQASEALIAALDARGEEAIRAISPGAV